jgi:hypothetical protein
VRRTLRLMPIALVVVLLMGSSAAYSIEFHHSTGLLVKVEPTKGTVLIAENGYTRELVVGRFALLFDDHGKGLKALKELQVGDYVYEDCILRKDGQCIAREIRIEKHVI